MIQQFGVHKESESFNSLRCPDEKVKTQKLLPKMDKGPFFIEINKVCREKYPSPIC